MLFLFYCMLTDEFRRNCRRLYDQFTIVGVTTTSIVNKLNLMHLKENVSLIIWGKNTKTNFAKIAS